MKILVIPSHYGFGGRRGLGNSGAGVFFKDQAIALARQGHKVALLYVHFDGEQGIEIEEVQDSGVRCLYVHAKPWPLGGNLLLRVGLMCYAYLTKCSSNPPDVIHAHNILAGLFAIPITLLARRPYVLTEHSPELIEAPRLRRRLMRKIAYAGASRILAVSVGLAERMEELSKNPITVVPNLVSESFFETDLEVTPQPVKQREFCFVSVGKSTPKKGWDVLISAFAIVINGGVDARLVLCGGGGDTESLHSQSTALGLQDRVSFTGLVSHDQVLREIRGSRCHVMPSRTETFGIASIEALALGKPIIMTNTFAASTIVTDFNGLIVDADRPDLLASAMRAIMDSEARYDPVRIREDCRVRFSESAVCEQLSELYEDAIVDHRSRRRWRGNP